MGQWYDMYSQATLKQKFLAGGGKVIEFKAATLNLPKTISRIWTVKQISELPAVKINGVEYEEVFNQAILKNIDVPVNKLLALGSIFVVPYLNKKGQVIYDVIADDDTINYLDYYIQDEELQYLIYVKSEKVMFEGQPKMVNMKYEHYIKDGVYYFKQYYTINSTYYVNSNDGTIPISNEKMLPFKVDLRINADSVGTPIWANAANMIEDCNKTYFEMMNAMELLRPVVGIPQALAGSSARSNDEITAMSDYHRLFMVVPGLEGLNEWKYFGGTYDPTPYIATLNAQLSDVSMQCGFGRKYLSYDEAGGLRTAKEVVFSQNDTFINQLMINQVIEYLIKRLMISSYHLLNNLFLEDEQVEVIFEDSVFNTREEYMAQLEFDRSLGVINNEFYLQERYPQEKVEDIIARNDDEFDSNYTDTDNDNNDNEESVIVNVQ